MKDQTAVLIGVAVGLVLSVAFMSWWLNQPDDSEAIGTWDGVEVEVTVPPSTTTTTTVASAPEPPPETTTTVAQIDVVEEPEVTYEPELAYEPEPEPEPEPETSYEGSASELTGIPDAYWDRMAVCETGGNWQHYPGSKWSGGLGMYTPEWLAITNGVYGPSAGHASRETQIEVANQWVVKYGGTYGGGLSGWGCLSQVGYP